MITPPEPQHFDVLIVGAGISGIGAAYHLSHQNPGKSYTILEAQTGFGGTWRTHKYPGIRSDSDLYTFGYRFKPWTGAPIASGERILTYLGEVIADNAIDAHIRYGHKITSAQWSSADNCWTIAATCGDTGPEIILTANFLWMCQGYYRHEKGYTPDWPGMSDFAGPVVHPQSWPEDLDYRDKNVVVIGSGATAATLVPAIASSAAHVTMLQRSPTYFFAERNANALADTLREIGVAEDWIHPIIRKKILFDQQQFVQRAQRNPAQVKQALLDGVRAYLGPQYDVNRDFAPRYDPWTQRIAFVPDGDLFTAIAAGRASVVTDGIDHFTHTGIALTSGGHLAADIVVTATGFDLCPLGDIAFSVDGAPFDWSQSVGYMGVMFTGLPNLAWVCGYFRASWTLRVDLIADFVCGVIAQMDKSNSQKVTVALRDEDADMEILPWTDTSAFNPGYVMRGLAVMPKNGGKPEWQLSQDYWSERDRFAAVDFSDPVFHYGA